MKRKGNVLLNERFKRIGDVALDGTKAGVADKGFGAVEGALG